MKKGLFRRWTSQIEFEFSESDLHNSRTQKLLKSEMRIELINDTHQIDLISCEVLPAGDGKSSFRNVKWPSSMYLFPTQRILTLSRHTVLSAILLNPHAREE